MAARPLRLTTHAREARLQPRTLARHVLPATTTKGPQVPTHESLFVETDCWLALKLVTTEILLVGMAVMAVALQLKVATSAREARLFPKKPVHCALLVSTNKVLQVLTREFLYVGIANKLETKHEMMETL